MNHRHHADAALQTAQAISVALTLRRKGKELPSLDDAAKAVANEETRRCQKYPEAVHNGKMTKERAVSGILAMEQVGRYLPAAARFIQEAAAAGDEKALRIVQEFGPLTINQSEFSL